MRSKMPVTLGATMMWAGVVALLLSTSAAGQELDKQLNEAIVMIPKKGPLVTSRLETTIFTPEGEGPFPVVVVNHGKSLGDPSFQEKDFARAFALAPNGAWGWASGGDDPLKRALDNCNKSGKGTCRLYAVDDAVVWKEVP